MPNYYIQIESRNIEENNFAYHWKVIDEKGKVMIESHETFPTRDEAYEHFNGVKNIMRAIVEHDAEEYPNPKSQHSPITDVNLEIRMLQNYKDEMMNRILRLEGAVFPEKNA